MLTAEEACVLYLAQFPGEKIIGILDIGDEYVISAESKFGGASYTPPTVISKDSKTFKTFFPPNNVDKLKNAVLVEIPEKFR